MEDIKAGIEQDNDAYEAALVAAGIVKKDTVKTVYTPEERAEKIKELLALLKVAKEQKDEKSGKKIRRILRKKFGFKISEHQVVQI